MKLVLMLALGIAAQPFAVRAQTSREDAHGVHAASEQYTARGVVKSLGANRAYVNIAHEAIPGYMGAMTMSFEPRRADQIAQLVAGDKVVFTFTATADGHRWIDSIAKQ